MPEYNLAAMIEQFSDDVMQLQIGDCLIGTALDEATCFGKISRQDTRAPLVPLEHTLQRMPRACQRQAEQLF